MEDIDVIIVGGGLAGLCAARQLAQAGRKVVLLEARDRWGGRICTYTDKDLGDYHIELGATWVGPTQDEVLALLKEYKLDTIPTYDEGKSIQIIRGHRGTYTGTIPPLGIIGLLDLHFALSALDSWCKTIDQKEPWKSPQAEYLDSITLETFLNKHICWTNSSKTVLDILVRTVTTTEPKQISALYFLLSLQQGGGPIRVSSVKDGAQQDVIAQGSQALPNAIANHLKDMGAKLLLDQEVTEIHQDDHGVIVKTRQNAEFRAKYCINCMPPALAGRLRYQPPLPAHKEMLLSRFPAGSIFKTVTFYDKPYWRQAGYNGQFVCDNTEWPVSYAIDHSSPDLKMCCLIGFIVGGLADKWRPKTEKERQEAVAAQYAEVFQIPEMKNPIKYLEKDWSEEIFTRGCYAGMLAPGVLTQYGSSLRENVGRVYFACTESAENWIGYMDGACRAGKATANVILDLLK